MVERSIYAQIDELNEVLEKRRQLQQRMRGHAGQR
jgi:predicted HAD superfamily phosphohydrolase